MKRKISFIQVKTVQTSKYKEYDKKSNFPNNQYYG